MLDRLLNVFSKEYRNETKYQEFMFQKVEQMKLKNMSENVEDKIKKLQNNSYVSNFYI